MIKYNYKMWLNIFGEVAKILLYSLTSFEVGMASIFTGLFAVNVLKAFGVSIYIQNAVFIPCCFFLVWGLWIRLIDANIERDSL